MLAFRLFCPRLNPPKSVSMPSLPSPCGANAPGGSFLELCRDTAAGHGSIFLAEWLSKQVRRGRMAPWEAQWWEARVAGCVGRLLL